MLAICSRNHSWLVKASLVFFLASGALTFVRAQTADQVIAKEVEGPGRMAHTFRFVKENGLWKIWQFSDTAEELTAELLAAPTDEARALALKRSEPFTDGLLKGLSDVATELLYRKGNDDQAAMILNIVLTIARRDNSVLGMANALIG